MTAPLTLDFVLNENYLVGRILDPEWKGHDDTIDYLREQAIEMSPTATKQLLEAYRIRFSTAHLSPFDASQQIVLLTEKTRSLLAELKGTPEHKEILEQTHAYKTRVEQEWLDNLDASLPFMQELTGLPLDGRYAVLVAHPSINFGEYLGARIITMGWSAEFANEDTVTLWHEILHDDDILVGGKNDEVGHSLIEISADNALRVHLNGEDYQPLHGEICRRGLRNKIFKNDWSGYLNSENKNIRKFKEEMQQKYGRI